MTFSIRNDRQSKITGIAIQTKSKNRRTYHRSGYDPYGSVHKSSSDGFLNRVAPPPDYPDIGMQNQLDDLSNAVSYIATYYMALLRTFS